MWLFYIAVPLIILAIIAAIAGGGIFTLILVPLAVIAVIGAVWAAISARAAQEPGAKRQAKQAVGEGGSELPHSFAGAPSRAPTSPEALADARREAQ
jgi:hypothetical protein